MPTHISDEYILKRPFGTLVLEKDITKQKILSMLEGAKKIVTVGDATTERLISFGITPDIAVIDGLEQRSRLVKVQGEEDMLAVPLFMIAPKGSAVLYGQPLEGIVLVNITEEKQNQAKDLMNKISGYAK
jgi:GTP-dependent dephospho-CoA kinase